jgi:hypothetical protein
MVPLEELQKYCIGKRIIIVGNSSGLLNNSSKSIIDGYDIVIRINRGYQYRQHLYDQYIGSKTDILSIGVKSAVMAANIIQGNRVNYILSPIIHSDRLNYHNVYDVGTETYNSLKESLGGVKPSTGISTYNFFNRFIDFARLDLIGFDFFSSSVLQRNQLGHIKVNDHDGTAESVFFNASKDPTKTKLYETIGATKIPNSNIPTYNQTNKFIFKNNNQR